MSNLQFRQPVMTDAERCYQIEVSAYEGDEAKTADVMRAGFYHTGDTALVDEDGARCLHGAIRAEANGSAATESDALTVLLEAIRRHRPALVFLAHPNNRNMLAGGKASLLDLPQLALR